jgi:hypothetical protein
MTNYPPSGPTSFDELLEPIPEGICDIAIRFRTLVKDAIPDVDEAVSGGAKMGMALYSIGGANNAVCGLQPTENMCRLFFHGWKRLEEAGYRLEGSGKHARHIKIRALEELDAKQVADMIKIAAEHRRAV